jgi:serine/threonine-protein kinase
VVAILDVDISDDGELFIVMERVDGRNVDALRRNFGDVTWALPLVAQLAAALEAIHAAEVVHRDLKPGNILLTNDGVLKVADFGIASLRTGDQSVEEGLELTRGEKPSALSPDVTGLTQVGAVLGSPKYMAPEALEGAQHTGSHSDVYSFGIIAYEMFSGQHASDQGRVPLAVRCPSLPREVAEIIDRCLIRDPKQRPGIREVCAVLTPRAAARARSL